jgi:hypothetical protein
MMMMLSIIRDVVVLHFKANRYTRGYHRRIPVPAGPAPLPLPLSPTPLGVGGRGKGRGGVYYTREGINALF